MSRKEDFFMAPSLSAGSLSGGVELSPDATYRSLQTKYMDFSLPQASVCFGLNNTTLKSIAADMVVNDISIELTCGFEASIARFRIYNVYDSSTGQFRYSALKKHLYMGNSLSISMGYAGKLETVFVGFVAGVSFGYQRGDLPYIEVSGMDAKGIMMAGGYACQLTADNYADAVSEILRRTAYEELKRSGAIRDIKVTATPDVDPSLLTAMQAQEAAQAAAENAQAAASAARKAAEASGSTEALAKAAELEAAAQAAQSAVEAALNTFNQAKQALAATKAAVEEATSAIAEASAAGIPATVPVPSGPVSDYTMEMAAESDYEFVVKAAKKFNYEFFVDRGVVYFRKAKSVKAPVAELSSNGGILNFNIEYSINGIVGSVEARAMDPGQGKIISSKSTFSNTISTNGMAKTLTKDGRKVLIDPTIGTTTQAESRVSSLMEQMSYRLGSLEAECVGLPELAPGRFLRVSGLGEPVDNDFYLTTVVHEYRDDTGFLTRVTGKADQIKGGGIL